MVEKPYTFYWRTGDREVYPGRNPADALNRAGYGGGAVRALDFYSEGENHDYRWDKSTREWIPTPEHDASLSTTPEKAS